MNGQNNFRKSVVGQIISGDTEEIILRQKSGKQIELGDLLVVGQKNEYSILQVYDLFYGSQIEQGFRELISGMHLETVSEMEFFEPELANYMLAKAKTIVTVKNNKQNTPKTLPKFFSLARIVEKRDFDFLVKPEVPVFLGNLRSGSKELDVPVNLPGNDIFSHHVLIAASTGKGKSNMVKVIAWNMLNQNYCGFLIFDPHDEYYGRSEKGLKDHVKAKENLVYYTNKNPPPGARTLLMNIEQLKPWYFQGVIDLSPAQRDALYVFFKKFDKAWVRELIMASGNSATGVKEETLAVLKRKFNLLGISVAGNELVCEGVFSSTQGQSTLDDILNDLERGKTIVIDTSNLSNEIELLVASMIATKCLNRYKEYKKSNTLKQKSFISIVLEEAPRVLGKDVLQHGENIFSTIAREGRKFGVGLTAVTQIPSLIPREILANMNTKIILGMELKSERQAIIDTASQDLSKDSKNIASLNKGEAIISSSFVDFAIPIKIPFFDEYVKTTNPKPVKKVFAGFGV
jgi:hypothetical protein